MKQKKLTYILFIIYILLLSWIILFKMQFDLRLLPNIRIINLIPFNESMQSEVINNILVFIPVGIYITILWKDKKIYYKIIFVIILSLMYEIIQFIFGIGITDITDILMNTLGGTIGIFIIYLIYKIFKNEKIDKVLNILALISTIFILSFISILIIANL